MAEMTDEELVRSHWESCGQDSMGIWMKLDCDKPDVYHYPGNWSAAAAFTRERLTKIAEVEEEIDAAEEAQFSFLGPQTRILARLQAALADLRKGMKEPSK